MCSPLSLWSYLPVLAYFPTCEGELVCRLKELFLFHSSCPEARFYPHSYPLLFFFFFFLLSYPSMWKSFLQCWMSEMFYLCLVGILWELFLKSLHFLFIVGGSELHVLFHHFDSFLSMKLYPSSLEFRLYQFYQILAKNIKIILYDVIRLLQRKAIVKNRFLLNVWK